MALPAWEAAHWTARLNLYKEVDWAALETYGARGRVVLVHHHVDPGTMDRVFAAEGTRVDDTGTPWPAWAPLGATNGELLWKVDPHTIAFAPRTLMQALASGERVAELVAQATATKAPLHAVFSIPDRRDGASAPTREVRIELALAATGIAMSMEIDGAPDASRVAAAVAELLKKGDREPGPAFQRLLDKLHADPSGTVARVQGIVTRDEILAAESALERGARKRRKE
jgi:hypothetical protein